MIFFKQKGILINSLLLSIIMSTNLLAKENNTIEMTSKNYVVAYNENLKFADLFIIKLKTKMGLDFQTLPFKKGVLIISKECFQTNDSQKEIENKLKTNNIQFLKKNCVYNKAIDKITQNKLFEQEILELKISFIEEESLENTFRKPTALKIYREELNF